MGLLSKFGKGGKKKGDLTVILLIKRNNGLEKKITYGRRAIDPEGDYFFKIKNPFGNNWFEMPDIPSEYISLDRIVVIYSPDLINFYGVEKFEVNGKNLGLDIIKVDNREWYKKGYKRMMKRAQKGWMDEHKAVILTIVMVAFVGIIIWLLISNLGGQLVHLNNTLSHMSLPVPLANPTKPPG